MPLQPLAPKIVGLGGADALDGPDRLLPVLTTVGVDPCPATLKEARKLLLTAAVLVGVATLAGGVIAEATDGRDKLTGGGATGAAPNPVAACEGAVIVGLPVVTNSPPPWPVPARKRNPVVLDAKKPVPGWFG